MEKPRTIAEHRAHRARQALEALQEVLGDGVPITVREDPPRGVYDAAEGPAIRSVTFVVDAHDYDSRFRVNG